MCSFKTKDKGQIVGVQIFDLLKKKIIVVFVEILLRIKYLKYIAIMCI